MTEIRKVTPDDLVRVAEIELFNYRLNFYPIFRNDPFYFDELRTDRVVQRLAQDPGTLENVYVYDDGTVKGFLRVNDGEIEKLFVEPVLHGRGIGTRLLEFAVKEKQARRLWVLEKNPRAIRFYERGGFVRTGEKKPEEDTDEFLLLMEKR